jgi:hypothetical protein
MRGRTSRAHSAQLDRDGRTDLAVKVRASRHALTRVNARGSMILVSDRQLRIVAASADLLPVEARGTFPQRVTAELRRRRDFSDCDVEQAVRAALLDQSAARSS